MILANLTQAFKTQNWFAVATEFLIVILGVVIGFQINAWGQARENRALAADYVSRLATEISTEAALWGKAADYFTVARDYGVSALAAYDRPADALDEEFLIALYQASQVWYVAPNRSTFQELEATGRIVHIRDTDLRTAIAQHYLRSAQTQVTLDRTSQYRRVARLHLHQDVQAAIRSACGDRWVTDETNFYYVSLPASCEIALAPDLVREQVAALHANTDVEQELRFHLSVLDANLGVIANTREVARNTLARLPEPTP
jgi:hypothetical protein